MLLCQALKKSREREEASPRAQRQEDRAFFLLGRLRMLLCILFIFFFFLFKNFFNRERSFGKKRKPSAQIKWQRGDRGTGALVHCWWVFYPHIVGTFIYLCIRRWTCTRTFRSMLCVVTKIGSHLCVYREMDK